MPTLIEERFCPDKEFENVQNLRSIQGAMSKLSSSQQEIVILAFGLDSDKPLSINKICKKLNISRVNCIKAIDSALVTMKENIKI